MGGVAVALKVGELYSTISLDASKFNQGVAAAQKQIEGMTTKLSQMSLSWNKVDQQLARISNNMRRSGIAMSKALTAPLVAIGGVAVKAALDVDEALDIIARGTGAQGEALKGLEQEWRKLATSVTQSFEDSAKVIADYNTRLGLTGKALRDLSKQALDASRMIGEDVNAVVAESAKAMQSWGVEADQMSVFLDKIFKASQDTGVGMSTLSSQLYYYAASLKSLGFDLNSSIALLAQFEREGVNLERIMSSLAMGLNQMARAGVTDANQAFAQLVREIQTAKTNAEATSIAVKVFGRSGAEMAVAIREGRFSVEALADALQRADGIIQQTSASTDSFDEKIVRVKNSIKLALEPLGTEMLNIAESVIPTLQRKSEEFATSIANMSDSSRKKIVEFAGTLAVGGPLLIAISATINAVRNLSSVVMAAFALPGSPWVLAAAAIAAVTYELYKFSKAQEQITGRTSAEVLDRSKYMKQAGEIFAERHGKYPITAQEYQELDKIIDELMSKERKAKIEITPTVTAPKKSPPTAGAAIDLSKLLGPGGEKATDEASKAVKAITDQVEYMGMSYETAIASLEKMKASLTPLSDAWKLATDTIKKYREELANSTQDQARLAGISAAAEIKRIEKVKQMQLEAQEAAAEGVRRFWQDVNWEYNQGLISAQEYFDMLSGELDRVTQGSEEWRAHFSELQRIALDIAKQRLDPLVASLQQGKITTDEFIASAEVLKGQFNDLPLVVDKIDETVKQVAESTRNSIDLVRDLGMTFESAFEQAIFAGNSLRDVLQGLLEDIARIILRQSIIKPLVGGLLGGLLGGFGFASGGVIQSGRIMPFAKGGIVTSPTIFPMANGAGLMGEAGPEAIMPLKRTSSGELGVKAEGGVDHISVTMNINAVDAKSFVDLINSNRTVIESIVVNNFTRNGRIRRVIQEAV